MCIAPAILYSQNNESVFEKYRQSIDSRFEEIRSNNDKVFEGYRDRMNQEFSSYLDREWEKTTLSKAIPNPFRPEPKPIIDNTPQQESRPLPHAEPVVIPEPLQHPKPIEPIPSRPIDPIQVLSDNDNVIIPDDEEAAIVQETPEHQPEIPEDGNRLSFSYLGNICSVRIPKTKEISIPSASNKEVSNAWNILSSERYNDLLVDCICIRKSLCLCDWAFYEFSLTLTEAYFGDKRSNESVALQVYIMSQLGYKIRLAKQENQLFALISFEERLFSAPYLSIDGDYFYCFSGNTKEGWIQICDFQFPGEQSCTVRMSHLPIAPINNTNQKTIKSDRYSLAAARVSVNKNLVDFYDNYPACSWEILAAASLSQNVKDQLYPSLRKAIANQSQSQSASILLNFVQTGFEYQTDDDQFGREKSFFGDETFYYPYCDCEDRSILYSILVRDLLGLDVVLLDYPTHIATAVNFTETVKGDYFDIDGKIYVICDPTYIGAPIGKSMPEMMSLKANILRIK